MRRELILDTIAEHKRSEVAALKKQVPFSELESALASAPAVRDFAGAIRRPQGEAVRVIAEVKKASPSKGVIREDFHPVEIARTYEANGAAAVSVLTDGKFFQGAPEYLSEVKRAINLPVLRKDFILDEYQIYQSRAIGADAVLLIVAMLTRRELGHLLAVARQLDLHCLVEVHDEEELDTALACGAGLIGVNNRNLKTFEVDTSTTLRLAARVPDEVILVSESGISSSEDVEALAAKGVHAVLIGETLMKAPDIGAKLREFTVP